MKRFTLIVIGALLLAAGIAACGSTPTVISTSASPPASTGLTPDEQTSLTFITQNTPVLEEIFSEQDVAVQDLNSGAYDAATAAINTYVAEWNNLKSEWESFPAAGGKVDVIEHQFTATANDLHDINTGIENALTSGDASVGVAAINQYAADIILLKNEIAGFSGVTTQPSNLSI